MSRNLWFLNSSLFMMFKSRESLILDIINKTTPFPI
jgi:hypothetical protein